MRQLRIGAFTLSLTLPLALLAVDTDGDGVEDELDNCSSLANAAPLDCDTDLDGYGNVCDADYNNDWLVGGPDYGTFLPAFSGWQWVLR